MIKTRIAILASGSGSTAEAFIREALAKEYPVDVVLVICNNPNAFILERVRNLNRELGLSIETVVINSHTQPAARPIIHGQQTPEEQEAILHLLLDKRVDLVLLLGYMKRIGSELLQEYGWQPEHTSLFQVRMLNTHPGLLPETIGTHGRETQEFTLEKQMPEGGQSLHVVSADYDMGPLVAEHKVPVKPDDTPDTLFARVQAVEKEHIAADIMNFIQEQQRYRKEHA